MKFRIIGADRETGEDVDMTIEALTPSAAEERVNRMGILVERMEPVVDAAPPAIPAIPTQQPQLAPQPTPAAYRERLWSPGVAAVLSLLMPGLGQLYKTQMFNGLVWFVVVLLGYMCLIIPGLILHLLCIVGAASGDPYKRAGGI